MKEESTHFIQIKFQWLCSENYILTVSIITKCKTSFNIYLYIKNNRNEGKLTQFLNGRKTHAMCSHQDFRLHSIYKCLDYFSELHFKFLLRQFVRAYPKEKKRDFDGISIYR